MMKPALFAAALALAIPSAAFAAPADIAAAVSAPGRPESEIALDANRRPVEVLGFFGLQQGARVLDFEAGTGYYSEIMARAVGPRGHVVGWNPPGFGNNPNVRAAYQAVRERQPNTAFYITPITALSFPPNSFDFVMMHMVYHDAYWENARFQVPRIDPAIVTRAIFDATRPGGTVAVVDHVANPGGDTRAVVEALHRIDPAVLRADFERAGFVFDGESDLLRNPADPHTAGVFDASIRGRTDRVVYRFRKPR